MAVVDGNIEYLPATKVAHKRAVCPYCNTWQPLAGLEGHNPACPARYVRMKGACLFVRVKVGERHVPPRKRQAIRALKHALGEA